MRYYIAHTHNTDIECVGKIARKLQIEHPENSYFSPTYAFSFLDHNDMGFDDFMEVCLDFLSACDVLIVASEISESVQREIDFAKLVGMEIQYLG
jgi:hypothetical protein